MGSAASFDSARPRQQTRHTNWKRSRSAIAGGRPVPCLNYMRPGGPQNQDEEESASFHSVLAQRKRVEHFVKSHGPWQEYGGIFQAYRETRSPGGMWYCEPALSYPFTHGKEIMTR